MMDITSLAPIIHRLRASIKEEKDNIREVKKQATKSGDFELAATARDWEKKLIEMKKILDPLNNPVH
jgi:hypothetical protein